MDNEKGREVKAHYLAVGRRMRAYSASLHKQWYESVDLQLLALLRRTLLVLPRHRRRLSMSSVVNMADVISGHDAQCSSCRWLVGDMARRYAYAIVVKQEVKGI